MHSKVTSEKSIYKRTKTATHIKTLKTLYKILHKSTELYIDNHLFAQKQPDEFSKKQGKNGVSIYQGSTLK